MSDVMERMAGAWTCGVTGLKVDPNAQKLILLHGVTAVVYLAIGGTLALLMALTRWPAVGLITDPEWFYRIVGTHGAAMLVFWILFFEMAGLIFGGSVLLNTRLRMPGLGYTTYGLMIVGSLLAAYEMLSGGATVMFTAYPPLEASPLFYASLLLFAVGALLGVLHFIGNVVAARIAGEVRTLPLLTFGFLAAAILAIFTLVSGAAAILPLFFWSIDVIPAVDPGVYRLLFWGFGHGAQQVNLAAMVAIWYGLASLTTGARPINEGLSRFAFVLYILFIQMGAMHHILVDPGLGEWARGINASYFLYAAVLGSMIHAFTIPASVEVAQREKGHTRGLLGWLRSAPWSSPGFSSLVISFATFGILGGISGVIMGGVQLNMISHNTLIVPAHFHMTVVSGTTIAFMGIAYYLVPLIARRDLFLPSWARLQPYIYGGGMIIFGIGMGLAGHFGVPRRHFDILFGADPVAGGGFEGGLPLANGVFHDPIIQLCLAMMAIGAVIAVIGGAMFVIIAAGTVFLGQRSETPDVGYVDAGALAPPEEVEAHDPDAHGAPAFEAPGTLMLASTWLTVFIVLYAWSWFELSGIGWRLG